MENVNNTTNSPGLCTRRAKYKPAPRLVDRAGPSSEARTLQQKDKDKHRIRDENNPENTHPSATKTSILKADKTAQSTVGTKNRYEALPTDNEYTPLPTADSENDSEEDEEVYQDATPGSSNIKNKKKPPLPIIVHKRIINSKNLINKLKSAAPAGFSIKLTRNATSIYITDTSQLTVVKDVLRDEGLAFHTYSEKEERTHAFVLEGLDEDVLSEEIFEELALKNIKVTKVYKMRNTRLTKFLIITDKTVTLRFLTINIRVMNYTRINWTRYNNKWVATQCHRCQKWGHSTTNCEASPACLKCAGDHLTATCTLGPQSQPKCANCGGEHLARCAECPVYTSIVARKMDHINRKQQQPKMRFVPAPPPKVNVWEMRTMERSRQLERNEDPDIPRISQPSRPETQFINSGGRTTLERSRQQVKEANPINPWAPQSRSSDIQMVQTVSHPTGDEQNNIGNLVNLTNECNRLSKHVDINKFLRLLKSLNDKMDQANNAMEKFELMVSFSNHINANGLN